jgi:chromosome segregation ATPase
MAEPNKIKLRNLDDQIIADIAAKIASGTVSGYNDTEVKNRISKLESEVLEINRTKFDKDMDKISWYLLDDDFSNNFKEYVKSYVEDNLSVMFNDLDPSLQDIIGSLQMDIGTLKGASSISTTGEDIANLKTRMDSCEINLQQHKEDIEKMLSFNVRLSNVELICNNLSSQLVSINNNIKNLETDIEKIKTKLDIK